VDVESVLVEPVFAAVARSRQLLVDQVLGRRLRLVVVVVVVSGRARRSPIIHVVFLLQLTSTIFADVRRHCRSFDFVVCTEAK